MRAFFAKMANRGSSSTEMIFHEADNYIGEIDDKIFGEREMLTAAHQLGKGRAPGLDDIPAEAYCCIFDNNKLRKMVLDMINQAYESGKTHNV